jgi:hypothetical protein
VNLVTYEEIQKWIPVYGIPTDYYENTSSYGSIVVFETKEKRLTLVFFPSGELHAERFYAASGDLWEYNKPIEDGPAYRCYTKNRGIFAEAYFIMGVRQKAPESATFRGLFDELA